MELLILGVVAGALAVVPLGVLWLMMRIALFGRNHTTRHGDVAVVLGARVIHGEACPVLRERVRHGVELWCRGQVRRVMLTGGRAQDWGVSECEAARRAAIELGAPEEVLILESSSRTTWENMVQAHHLMQQHGLETALIVSDPPHMMRAMAMARRAGLRAEPAPTAFTRYRSRRKRAVFLWREARSYLAFRLLGF